MSDFRRPFLLLMALVYPAAFAADGNNLLASCKALLTVKGDLTKFDSPVVAFHAGHCHGLIDGVVHTSWAYQFSNLPVAICIPSDFSQRQSARLVVDYLESHPDELGQTDSVLVAKAFHQKHPCPAK